MRQPSDTFRPRDVADLRRLAEARMPHRAAIHRPTLVDDGSGGQVETFAEVATTRCALTRMSQPREIAIADAVSGIADWRMLCPLDTDLHPQDVVLPWWLWRVTLGPATAGSFTLTYGGFTATLAWNATGAQVETALQALPSIRAGNIRVTGAVGGPHFLRFTGRLDAAVFALTANFTGLTGADASLARYAFQVLDTEDVATDAPQVTAYLTWRR